MRGLVAAMIAVTALSACSKNSGLVGSYIDADYGDGVVMVQIDSLDHREVHGTISMATFDGTGVVNSRRVPIAGTVDGKALNLSVENGTGTNLITGSIVPAGLDLTLLNNGHSLQLLLKRRNAADFSKLISSLRTQSAKSQQDKQEAAFKAQDTARGLQVQSQIDAQVDRLLSDAETITAKTRQLDNAVAYYQRISARDAQLRVIAARAGSGDVTGRAAEAEGQLDGNRTSAESAHDQVQIFWHNVQGQSEAEIRRANDFVVDCQSDTRLTCSRLTSAVGEFGSSVSALRTALAREEEAYNRSRF